MPGFDGAVECYVHEGRRAVGACVDCGRFVCEECRVTLGGRIHCKACLERSRPDSEEPPPRAATGELRRSRTDRVLGGVCAGLAKEFRIETGLCRVLTVLVTILTGIVPGMVVYCVLWAVLKEE